MALILRSLNENYFITLSIRSNRLVTNFLGVGPNKEMGGLL